MANTENIHTGHIVRFDKERNYGFIETDDNATYFFFFDKAEQLKLKKSGLIDGIHKFCSGDEVEFKLRPSLKNNNQVEAWDVKFIRNLRRQQLIEEAVKCGTLQGYLKQIDDSFFVKHLHTYVFIPIELSDWETEIESVYIERLDSLVKFNLSQTAKIDKLSAILIDRRLCEEYGQILELINLGHLTEAIITGKNNQGYFATILNGRINGFIQTQDDKIAKFRKADRVWVHIKHVFNNKRVSLKIPE